MFKNVGAEPGVELLSYWSREVMLPKSQALSKLGTDFGIKAVGSKIETSNG